MTKSMLIDATHPEETRVVVVDGQQLADFDFESSTKRQIKGNVYLAKVTRVEPSLQAAFIEYGGGRHGFLAFSEIHPDYYQVPQADREMLEKLEREGTPTGDSGTEAESASDAEGEERPSRLTEDADEETAEVMGEQARARARLLRSYKIQEVIKRRQILLVQVVKEERGNKGAALTTYLSLAGRYGVLMPNTPRGGGISRKIQDAADRKRLKTIVQDLKVPQGMGLIVRTAGQERSRAEIRRDYDYLLRLWSDIRETTLKSIAPCLIYEEGNLVKRAIRDIYTRDVEEVLVEGEEAYKDARRLMQMIMPSRARLVKPYKDEVPLFFRYRVEDQLDAMYSPVVQLPSGGSIVMHTTEALIAVDVNSGRSTRERHIDETALKTNLEAADEVSRQLRLRDLAGLVVIDFIDMSEGRHQKMVERRLRDALKLDRARIQLGRISMFGLMELSRQRLRPSLQELSSQSCPTCQGLGVVRSTESCALQALRLIQEAGIKGAAAMQVTLPADVGLYLLNQKRDALHRLEARYTMQVVVAVDTRMMPAEIDVQVSAKREVEPEAVLPAPASAPAVTAPDEEGLAEAPRRERPTSDAPAPAEAAADEDEDTGGKKRRRRRRRRRRDEPGEAPREAAVGDEADAGGADADEREADETIAPAPAGDAEAEPERSRRRRKRRGGGRRGNGSVAEDTGDDAPPPSGIEGNPPPLAADADVGIETDASIVAAEVLQDVRETHPAPAPAYDVDTPAIEVAAAGFDPLGDEERAPDVPPAIDAPVAVEMAPVETPEAQAPVAEAPAIDAPAIELSAAEPPAVEAPAIEPAAGPVDDSTAPPPAVVLAADGGAAGAAPATAADGAVDGSAAEPAAAAEAPREAVLAAEVVEEDNGPPRQGWWSRWVR